MTFTVTHRLVDPLGILNTLRSHFLRKRFFTSRSYKRPDRSPYSFQACTSSALPISAAAALAHPASMSDSTTSIKAALWAFIGLAFGCWILSIIGLAGLQRQCYFQPNLATLTGGSGDEAFGGDLPFVGIRGLNRSYGCNRLYSYYWMMLAIELVSLIGLCVLTPLRLLAASGLSWLAWLTVCTALFIQGSDTFLAITHQNSLFGQSYRYSRLASAGWVLTCFANLALIFILGWRPRRVASNSGGKW